jgi:hypothetical protein
MSMKDFKPILTALRQQGWQLEQTMQGHWRATAPDAAHGIVHFSTSDDPHAQKNIVRDLRKRGFVWPAPAKNILASARHAQGQQEEPSVELAVAVAALATEPPPEAPPPAPAPDVTPVCPNVMEASMDQLFVELKEAKQFFALTDEHLVECEVKFKEAQKAVADAIQERERAAAVLREKKQEFDRVFAA